MNKTPSEVYIPKEDRPLGAKPAKTLENQQLTVEEDKMTEATTFDEAEILVEVRDGDTTAFGTLVNAYQRRAYAVAYSFVGNREDALELAQDSFAKAYKAMHSFDTKLPFYPWLYRIIKNTCLNHLKKRKRRGEISLEYLGEAGHQIESGDVSPSRSAELDDLRKSLSAAMRRVSDEHREVLVLRHFQELSYSEIAECLDVPKGTVMSRLYSARRSLKKEIESP